MAKNLLDLETLARQRDTFTVDSLPFELLAPDDFSFLDQAEFMRIGRKLKRLGEPDVTDKEVESISDQLKTFVKRIVRDFPDDVNEKLSDAQRVGIVNAFMLAMPGVDKEIPTPASPNPPQLAEPDRLKMEEILNSPEFKQTLVA